MKKTIQKVLIVGAGNMGCQIAACIIRSGFRAALFDNDQSALDQALKTVAQYAPGLDFKASTHWPDLISDVDLVIETISENLALKRSLFKMLDKIMERDVIFTSNSSDLLPSQIVKSIHRKELFCAYHFHAPMFGARVVDIMPHPDTTDAVISVLTCFTRQMELIPVVLKKEHPAYIYNCILNSIMDRSVELVIQGVADIEDVDRSWMGNTGMTIGPFGMLDVIGLDTAMEITRLRARKKPCMRSGIAFFNRYVKEGKLGLKTGQGFYHYPNPKYQRPDFLS
ncbi:MAG: 3-hydroxybutyryl-CoA dehydrogenase [Candidatus Delongbacteria bacterium]|nr:3-hydroxybutyryl-CoA dehydrogenase [Candidatus Delongbacteria bacterium]